MSLCIYVHAYLITFFPCFPIWSCINLLILWVLLKSLWGTIIWSWSSLNLRLTVCLTSCLHEQMRPLARRLEITVLYFIVFASGVSRAGKHFTAHRWEEMICCLWACSIHCSLFYCLWLEAGGYLLLCSIDLYNSKQYRLCPHAALQSIQIESSSKGFQCNFQTFPC